MLKLERKGSEVYFNGTKLKIAEQAKKGPGHECVNIEGLPGANGAKWVSLSRLSEGINELEPKPRTVTSTGNGRTYELTADEREEVTRLQARIDEIIQAAKARFVPKPKLLSPDQVKALPQADRLAYLDQLKAYYGI